MDRERLTVLLRALPGATEGTSWGPEHWVYKVAGRVFAVLAWDEEPMRLSLKCDPDRVEELRAVFPAVRPPAYFNRRHWNAVVLDGTVPEDELEEMIRQSHRLVVAGLSRRLRDELGEQNDR